MRSAVFITKIASGLRSAKRGAGSIRVATSRSRLTPRRIKQITMLPKKAIEEFKKIYKKSYGVELSDRRPQTKPIGWWIYIRRFIRTKCGSCRKIWTEKRQRSDLICRCRKVIYPAMKKRFRGYYRGGYYLGGSCCRLFYTVYGLLIKILFRVLIIGTTKRVRISD